MLGHGYLIFCYAFLPIVAKWTHPVKKCQFHFIFYCPPDSGTNQLMVPQKWFTYENMQYFTRKIVSSKTVKGPSQKIKILIRSDLKNKILIQDFYFILPSSRLLQNGSRMGMSSEKSRNHGLSKC